MRSRSLFQLLTLIGLAALILTACGGSSKKKSSSSSSGNAGGTLTTVAKAAPSGSPDPQIDYTLQEWQLLILTHDGLVGFKRAGGKEGTKIVADLAQSVPKPTTRRSPPSSTPSGCALVISTPSMRLRAVTASTTSGQRAWTAARSWVGSLGTGSGRSSGC